MARSNSHPRSYPLTVRCLGCLLLIGCFPCLIVAVCAGASIPWCMVLVAGGLSWHALLVLCGRRSATITPLSGLLSELARRHGKAPLQ